MAHTAPHSSPASPALTRLAQAITLALALLFAWQLAHWTWHFLTPAETPRTRTADSTPADWETARRLFGEAPAPGPTASSGGLRLKGVYAVDGKTLSAAVINTGAKRDVAVKLGESIEPGVTLAAVYPDYVEISRAGVRERIDIDKRLVAPAAGKPGAGTPAAQGFRLNVATLGANSFSLSRSELNTTLQDPKQLAYTGRVGIQPGGGVRLDSAPKGSLPDRLGLKEGDIIKSINGQTINSPGDLARLYGQFATLANIRAEVTRSGSPVVLNFQVQP